VSFPKSYPLLMLYIYTSLSNAQLPDPALAPHRPSPPRETHVPCEKQYLVTYLVTHLSVLLLTNESFVKCKTISQVTLTQRAPPTNEPSMKRMQKTILQPATPLPHETHVPCGKQQSIPSVPFKKRRKTLSIVFVEAGAFLS